MKRSHFIIASIAVVGGTIGWWVATSRSITDIDYKNSSSVTLLVAPIKDFQHESGCGILGAGVSAGMNYRGRVSLPQKVYFEWQFHEKGLSEMPHTFEVDLSVLDHHFGDDTLEFEFRADKTWSARFRNSHRR